MISKNIIDKLRPYNHQEMREVLTKLLEDTTFINMYQLLFPDVTVDTLKKSFASIQSVYDFQKSIMIPILDWIKVKSMKEITFSGIENISKNKGYLFLSNHRDILIDPSFLNYTLMKNNFDTTEIALGDNLLGHNWIKKVVKLNKGFIVKRGLSPKEMLLFSKDLSEYIHYVIKHKKHSIWIAHREGRAKDGNDKTSTGLLKMLGMSNKNFVTGFSTLNIVPLAISYEFNPCDTLILKELIAKEKGEKYTKAEGEDLENMETGVMGYKGNMHISIGLPINEKIQQITGKSNNEKVDNLAKLIDKHIHQQYKLFSSNYIAYDILNKTNTFEKQYSLEEKTSFINDVEKKIAHYPNDKALAKKLLLEMYANPVKNKDV